MKPPVVPQHGLCRSAQCLENSRGLGAAPPGVPVKKNADISFQWQPKQSPASQELEKDASAEPDSHPKAIETPAPKGEQPKAESKDDKENAAPVAVPISGNAAAEIKLLKSLVIVMAILMGIMCLLMMNINSKLEALSPKDNPIVETKLINYTWDMPYTMENEFSTAVREGFEPAGYVCQNSIKGGFFLFVKRRK